MSWDLYRSFAGKQNTNATEEVAPTNSFKAQILCIPTKTPPSSSLVYYVHSSPKPDILLITHVDESIQKHLPPYPYDLTLWSTQDEIEIGLRIKKFTFTTNADGSATWIELRLSLCHLNLRHKKHIKRSPASWWDFFCFVSEVGHVSQIILIQRFQFFTFITHQFPGTHQHQCSSFVLPSMEKPNKSFASGNTYICTFHDSHWPEWKLMGLTHQET